MCSQIGYKSVNGISNMYQERTCTEYESQPNNRDLGCARCHLLQYLGLPVRQPRYKPSTLIAYPYCPPTRPKARINKLLHPKVNLQVREQFVWSFANENRISGILADQSKRVGSRLLETLLSAFRVVPALGSNTSQSLCTSRRRAAFHCSMG